MTLAKIDAWLGKTLFHPPIIWLCQLTRQSQYALHRAFWFFAACHATYYARDGSWLWVIFLWLWVLSTMVDATMNPDRPARSHGFMRGVLWAMMGVSLMSVMTMGVFGATQTRLLIMLFAEYAATIKTIPPRKKPDTQKSRATSVT